MASTLNITGLSGIDTQEWLDQLMSAKRKPLDTLFQKQQSLLWKQEAYQEQYTSISKLRDLAFNLKLESNYATKKVSSSNSQIATATATSGAGNASYLLNVTRLASAATNSSTQPVSIRSSVTSKEFDVDTASITIDGTNNSFQIKLDDGSYQTITLPAGTYGTYTGETGLKDLAADIQEQLDATFTDLTDLDNPIASPLYVKVTSDNQLMFYAGQKSDGSAHTIVLNSNGADATLSNLGFSNYDSTKAITGSIRTDPVTVNATNNKFKISIGGVTQEVTLDSAVYDTYGGASPKTLQDLAGVIQQELTDLGGDFAKVDVSVNDFDQISFNYEDTDDGDPKSITLQSGSLTDILQELGIATGTVSEYPKQAISTTGTLLSQKDKFANSKFFDDLDTAGETTFGFTINGQSFSFQLESTSSFSGASLSSIIAEINGNSAAGVSVYYDEFTDKLVMTSTKTGNNNESGNEIQITDPSGFFSSLLNVDSTEEKGGENALVTVNGVTTERLSNSFSMNGVSFNLMDMGTTMLTVSTDLSDVNTKVEEFINSYNEIITALNGKLTEERATSGEYEYFLPLTDEQRETLSDDQIKTWEAKAKQGILRRDTLLTGVVNELRTTFSKTVSTPRTISGTSVTGNISLGGSNRITVTLGTQCPREIILDEASVTLDQAKADLQQKLNLVYGQGQILVEIKNNALQLTTQNTALTLNSGSTNDGLNLLGFYDGATVSASYDRLSQIGITTGEYTENGKLHLDKEAFQAALEKDPDAVVRLLTNFESQDVVTTDTNEVKNLKKKKEEDSKGILYKLHEILNASLTKIANKAGTSGTIGGNNTVGEELKNINKRISTLEDRLENEESRLSRQFAAMERALADMNAQASYFSNLLGQS